MSVLPWEHNTDCSEKALAHIPLCSQQQLSENTFSTCTIMLLLQPMNAEHAYANLFSKILFSHQHAKEQKRHILPRIGYAIVINLNTSPDSTIKPSRFRVQYHVILTAAAL